MNVKKLVQGLSYVGEAEGKRQRYYVFRGGDSIRSKFKKSKRIVVKVGTSTLTHSNGKLNFNRIDRLVREMADLHNQEYEVILVSSGAIGTGANRMGMKSVPME
jgi:UDP-glucose 6-dehydrogenase